jgi:hypothetical protein
VLREKKHLEGTHLIKTIKRWLRQQATNLIGFNATMATEKKAIKERLQKLGCMVRKRVKEKKLLGGRCYDSANFFFSKTLVVISAATNTTI